VNRGGSVVLYSVQFGLPSFLLIIGSASIEISNRINWPKLLVFLGDASYSIYLTHAMFVNLFTLILNLVHVNVVISPFITTLMITIFAIFGGSTMYRFLERPLLIVLRKKLIMAPVRTGFDSPKEKIA
jgi:exopolysaccharide production protein ExoZ